VRDYISSGPVVVVYDDSFPGVADEGEALEAVAELVRALSAKSATAVLPLLDACNSMGARDLAILPGDRWGLSVADRLLSPDSQVRAAFLLGVDVASTPDEAVVRRLNQLHLLVVSELFLTETARLADVVLPAASFAEKLGTFTSSERRVQLIREAVPSPGLARADWEALVDLSQYFDRPLGYALPQDLWDAIRASVPAYAGIGYADIGGSGVRPENLQRA
jgi:predicted molibdopterin-dependent oxidoreductase YjgC